MTRAASLPAALFLLFVGSLLALATGWALRGAVMVVPNGW